MFMDYSLTQLQQTAEADGRECVVGALILNAEGQVFAMRRAHTRRLFPGCWDIVGGHVEPGETLLDALAREITEETGWALRRVLGLIEVFDWEVETPSHTQYKREFDCLVDVDGDLDQPQLEVDTFTEYRWFGLDQIEVLRENRTAGDWTIYHLIKKTLELAGNRHAA